MNKISTKNLQDSWSAKAPRPVAWLTLGRPVRRGKSNSRRSLKEVI